MSVIKLHLSLNVRDVAYSTRWYEAFFGRPPHKVRPGYANFDVSEPPIKLALVESDEVSVSGHGTGPLNHLGILVPSPREVNQAKTRLESAGLITFAEVDVTCCYARQDKIWVRDPDGNAWEVYTIVDDGPPSDDPASPAVLTIPVLTGHECSPGCCGTTKNAVDGD